MKKKLISLGIKEKDIKNSAGTGLVVDIFGSGPEDKKGINCSAIRADMDALPIPEAN